MKKEENDKQKEFIDITLQKLKDNITKFIVDTNYSNIQSLYLRQQIDNYEKDFIERNQNKRSYSLSNKSLTNETILPLIINNRNPRVCLNKSKLYNSRKKNNMTINENIKRTDKFYDLFNPSFSVKDSLTTEIKKLKNKEYLKYCNEYRNQRYYHPKLFDKNNNSIIRKEDMDKGIYDMISKGLIPKSADISPAMNFGGNPFSSFSIRKKNMIRKNKLYGKEEIVTTPINKFKYNQYDIEEVYNIPKQLSPVNKEWAIRQKRSIPYYHETISENIDSKIPKHEISNNEINNKDKIFITGSEQDLNYIQELLDNNNLDNISDFKNKNNSSLKFNNSSTTKCNTINYNNSSNINNNMINSSKLDSDILKTFYDFVSDIDMKNNLEISFDNYKVIKNKNYNEFKKNFNDKWYEIENIINNMENLFQKLNISIARVDSNKILSLLKYYNNKIQNITNKDLLECLTKEDIEEKGLDPKNEKQLYKRIKEAFVIRIQKMLRKKLAYNRYQFLKILNINVTYLQSNFRRFVIEKKIKKLLEEERKNVHNKFMEMFKEFKSQWENIQDSARVEIHFYSISNDSYHNCLIDKYSLKECLQLNRLIRLVDPNIEIIYILPIQISDEILTYYFSLLESLGIKNLENRLHLIIPEAIEYLPCNYSLSKLLYLSPNTIKQIKDLTKDRNSYIVPGTISPLEENISYVLNKPIFMGNKEQIDLIFNKSGIKSAFELNEIPFPISAWDLKTEEEFYSSLAHLIVIYPTIQVWIFKCNLDSNGKGIAYLNISDIEIINELKYEKKINPEFTDDVHKQKLYIELKNILIKNVKFSYPNLYSNWNEYIKKFLNEKGIIECCPTKNLDGVMNNPCLPIFIEPNGKIRVLPSFEKINVDFFKNIACTSPQNSINNGELNKIGEQIGNFLYSQEIIGYITLEFITFHDGKKMIYWGVDMKYGLTQQICDLQFCYILYVQSSIIKNNKNYFNIFLSEDIKEESEDSNKKENNEESESNSDINNKENCSYIIDNKNYSDILSDTMVFSFHYLSTEYIREIKLKDFLKEFRYSNLIFDIEKKEGIIFNLCDGLECGIFGLCGIINLDTLERIYPSLKLWKLIYKTIILFKDYVYKTQRKNVINNLSKGILEKNRNDQVDLHSIINKVKNTLKEKEIEQEKEEKRRKIIANTPYL